MSDLTPTQRRAAQLLAQGLGRKVVAAGCRTSEKTISRWKAKPEFRRAMSDPAASAPDLRAVIAQSLTAVKRDGSPDHAVRIAAAKLALQEDLMPEPPAPREVVIYRCPECPHCQAEAAA